MLPGFRFLVAAVVLCLSLVVFGFGATALLRSAREEFASLPVRRAAPQTAYGSQQLPEAPPMLSMLRIEPPEIRSAAPVDIGILPQDRPAPAALASEPERVALPSQSEPAAEIARAEPARPESAPVLAALMPVAAEPRADEPATVTAMTPTASPDQPASTLTEEDEQIAMLNVATLGGPAVDIEPAPLPKAKPVVTVKKKARVKVVKEKPAKRRRVADRTKRQNVAAVTAPAPAPAETFGWQQPR